MDVIEVLACAAPPAASWRTLASMVAFVLLAFAVGRPRTSIGSAGARRSG